MGYTVNLVTYIIFSKKFGKRVLTGCIFWKQRTGQDHVDIITFYNEIFIPTVKPLLVELGPSGATAKPNAETSNKVDGISGLDGMGRYIGQM